MIINVRHQQNRLTLDFRLRQIRYLAEGQPIQFRDMSHTTSDAFECLFKEDASQFLDALAEEAEDLFEVPFKTKDLSIESGSKP